MERDAPFLRCPALLARPPSDHLRPRDGRAAGGQRLVHLLAKLLALLGGQGCSRVKTTYTPSS